MDSVFIPILGDELQEFDDDYSKFAENLDFSIVSLLKESNIVKWTLEHIR